jgi:murE/murF fusion protein
MKGDMPDSMKLWAYVQDLPASRVVGNADVAIRAVCADSRAVERGDLFVALRGQSVDGHRYIDQALGRGAAALVVDHEVAATVPQVIVPDTTAALGLLAARAAGRPADALCLIGITGTNGKTTSTYLVESILREAGASPGVIGTVSYRYAGREIPAPYTTPTPIELHRALADMRAAGCTHAVLETSSAALAMQRLAGVGFRVAAFTNLSQDHLDVHETMGSYQAAKTLLFSAHLGQDATAIAMIDDPVGPAMLAAATGATRRLRVCADADTTHAADVRVAQASSTVAGIHATIQTPRGRLEVTSQALLGAYNVANIALAVAVGEALALPQDAIVRGVAALVGVPGRVERVANGHGLDILVDYAHTPDALANVLDALRRLTRRRLLCVFGCGGDRDPTKRAKMGRAVAARADVAIVTSDNPRTEDPDAILQMILDGVPDPSFVHRDRRTAIRVAVAEAAPGDVVLIAGKGHEDYQILGTQKIHFDDREEAAAAAATRESVPAELILRATGAIATAPAPTAATTTAPASAAAPPAFTRVIIDGRIAAPGDLYVAIRGESFDGHDFCAQACAGGAAGLVVAAGRAPGGASAGVWRIEVADTRVALGEIARAVRRRWGKPVIGVTGSTGKTTTKDLIAAALSAAGCPLASQASLNNETGVPLTLLRLRGHHDWAVVEMGMRALGEIEYLSGWAEPDVGVVVNAGVAHVGVVGSVESIARGKAEIFARLPAHGAAILPAGDPRLAEHAAAAPRRITFGDAADADVRLLDYRAHGAAGSELHLGCAGREHRLVWRMVGRHSGLNAVCAVAACLAVGVPIETALAGLAGARPPRLRSQIAEIAGRHVLIDCYNANPASMTAALATLADLRGARTAVAVLGDMLELGDDAEAAHREAGRQAGALGLVVVVLGDMRNAVVAGAREGGATKATAAADPEAAARAALAMTGAGDWILVKASRGMRLERVVDALAKVGGVAPAAD